MKRKHVNPTRRLGQHDVSASTGADFVSSFIEQIGLLGVSQDTLTTCMFLSLYCPSGSLLTFKTSYFMSLLYLKSVRVTTEVCTETGRIRIRWGSDTVLLLSKALPLEEAGEGRTECLFILLCNFLWVSNYFKLKRKKKKFGRLVSV